jgi:hypothetical protein
VGSSALACPHRPISASLVGHGTRAPLPPRSLTSSAIAAQPSDSPTQSPPLSQGLCTSRARGKLETWPVSAAPVTDAGSAVSWLAGAGVAPASFTPGTGRARDGMKPTGSGKRTDSAVRVLATLEAPMSTTQPRYSRIEHERKWLVRPGALALLNPRPFSRRILDRYLDCGRLRLRAMEESDGLPTVYKLTKKYPADAVDAQPIVSIFLSRRVRGVARAPWRPGEDAPYDEVGGLGSPWTHSRARTQGWSSAKSKPTRRTSSPASCRRRISCARSHTTSRTPVTLAKARA